MAGGNLQGVWRGQLDFRAVFTYLAVSQNQVIYKPPITEGSQGCGSVAEHLTGMRKDLGSIPSTAGKNKEKGFFFEDLNLEKHYYVIR